METNAYQTLSNSNNTTESKKTCINQINRRLFHVFDLAIDYSSQSKFGVFLICFFELVQLLSFSFNIIFTNQWMIQEYSSVFELANKILKIFLIEPYFKETSFVFYQIMFFAFLVINIIILLLFIYLVVFIKDIKRLNLIGIMLFNLSGQLFNSVLLIPTLDIVYPMIRCNKYFSTNPYSTPQGNTVLNTTVTTIAFCSTGKAYAYLALGVIMIIISFTMGLLFSLFYYDIRSVPTQRKENKMSTITNRHNIYLFFDKYILCILFFYIDDYLDKTYMFLSFSLFASSVIFAAIITMRMQHSFFSSFTKKCYDVLSYIFIVTNLALFIDKVFEYFLMESFHGIVEIWLLGVFIAFLYDIINKEDLTLSLPSMDIRIPSKVIYRLHMFAKLIRMRPKDKAAKKIIDGYICTHCDQCPNAQCILRTLQNKALITIDGCPIKKSDFIEEEKLLMLHLNEIYASYIGLYHNDASIRISYGFFSLLQFKNVNVAKMHSFMAYTCKPNLLERFDLFRLEKAIKDEYLNISEEALNIDIASTLIFEQYYKQFQSVILQIGVYYNTFWTKFNQAEMTFNKIKSSGLKIIQLITKAFKLWKSMQNIQPNDRESLKLYGIFISELMNERALGQSYIDKSQEITSMGLQVKLFKNDINSICTDGSPICIATPNENQELIISQVNQSMTRWFGYSKMELIGRNIEVLIPDVLKHCHQKAVEKYIKLKSTSKSIEQKRVYCLAINRLGYVFPVKMILILMPSLTSDAHVGIVLKKNKKTTQAYMSHLIIDRQMDIINISTQCIKMMNLSDRAIWTIKNYAKIKAKERISLMRLIQEYSPLASIVGDELNNNKLMLKSNGYGVIHNQNIGNTLGIGISNVDDESNHSHNEESIAFKTIKSIIKEPNQSVNIIYLKESKVHTIKTGIRRMSRLNKVIKQHNSNKNHNNNHNSNNDNIFLKRMAKQSSRLSNFFNRQSSLNMPQINKKKYYHDNKDTSLEHFTTPIQANISILPIKFASIETGYFIVQLQHDLNKMMPLQKQSSSQTPNVIGNYLLSNKVFNTNAKMNYINDIRYSEKYKIIYDKDNHKYISEKSNVIQMYTMSPVQKPSKVMLNSHLILVDQKRIDSRASSSSSFDLVSGKDKGNGDRDRDNKDIDADEKDSLIQTTSPIETKKDVYNTLNFTDYSHNVIFYELDPTSLMCGQDSKPPPLEGKYCQDLKNFFDQDTQKDDTDDDEGDDDNDEKFDKNKYEIRKSVIFQRKKKSNLNPNIDESLINLRIGSFIGILIHLIIATSSFALYEIFLNKSDIYTKGLYRISSLLNYTITSSDLFLDLLVIQSVEILDRDNKLMLFNYLQEILKNNSAIINELSSLADTDTVLSIVNREVAYATVNISDLDPLQMHLSHLISFDTNDNDKPIINKENCTFHDATIQIMSVIYQLALLQNMDVTFFDKNVFFLCFNSINDYYIKSIKYIKSIGLVLHNLSPTEKQTTIIYVSLGVYILLLFGLFIILRKNLIKINNTVLKFLLIQQSEIQSIVKQSTKLLRYIRIIHNNEEDEDEVDNEEGELENNSDNNNNNLIGNDTGANGRQHTSKTLQARMKRSIKEDFILVLMLLLIFIPIELYYIIQFIIVYSFNNNLDQFVSLYSSSYFYITNMILISSGAKISKFAPDPHHIITLLNQPIENSILVCLDQLMTDKEALSKEIFISQFLSENFTSYYNEEIAYDLIDKAAIDYKNNLVTIPLNKLNFDSSHAYYYNMIKEFYSVTGNEESAIISQADTVKNKILSPFIQKLCDALYADVNGFLVTNRNFVLAWYICMFITVVVLYFSIWVPMELRFEKELTKTKLLLLLIPTKILMNKKSILDILKKENMVTIKK